MTLMDMIVRLLELMAPVIEAVAPVAPIVGGALAVLAALVRLYAVWLGRRRRRDDAAPLTPQALRPRRGLLARVRVAVRRYLRRTR